MTVGELALMIKGERMLSGLEGLDLRVIRMSGWRRGMQWPETGLKWLADQPQHPRLRDCAPLSRASASSREQPPAWGAGPWNRSSWWDFRGINAGKLADHLNRKNLPGARFESVTFTPKSIPGMSSRPKYQEQEIPGIKIIITDQHSYRPVETAVHIICALYGSLGNSDRERFFQVAGFDHLAGTHSLRHAIERGVPPEEIIAASKEERGAFCEEARKIPSLLNPLLEKSIQQCCIQHSQTGQAGLGRVHQRLLLFGVIRPKPHVHKL